MAFCDAPGGGREEEERERGRQRERLGCHVNQGGCKEGEAGLVGALRSAHSNVPLECVVKIWAEG